MTSGVSTQKKANISSRLRDDPVSSIHPSPDSSQCAIHLGQALLCHRRVSKDALCPLHIVLCLRETGAEVGAPAAEGQPRGRVAETSLAQAQALDVAVVSAEARVAQLTAWVGAAVAPLALVTVGARDTWAAETLARGLVTPHVFRALEVTVALWARERERQR